MTLNKRTTFSQLPTKSELNDILTNESVTIVPEHLKDKTFVNNDLPIKWLKALGLDNQIRIFTEKLDIKEILNVGNEITEQVVKRTLELKERVVISEITKYLGESEDQKLEQDGSEGLKSNFIFILGSGDTDRVLKGAQLYKAGVAPMVVISGGKPNYDQTDKLPEAVIFSRVALENGIPKDRLIIDPNAITIADSVKTFINWLKNVFSALETEMKTTDIKVAVVIAWFAQRRLYSYFKKFGIGEVYRFNSPLETGNITMKSWSENETGIKVIWNEFIKMRMGEIYGSN